MTKNELYARVDDLASQLYHEQSLHLQTKNRLAHAEEENLMAQKDWKDEHLLCDKQVKEIKRLETANKKFMQAIDALKKQIVDKEIDRDRYAREVALKLAYVVAKSDDHISTHAKLNYQFITDTEPVPVIDNTLTFEDDLKVTHIDEV